MGNGKGFNGSDLKFRDSVDGNRNLRGNVGGLGGSNGLGKHQGYGGSSRAVAPPPGFVAKSGGNRDRLGDRWGSEQSGFGSGNWRETDSNGRDGGEGRSTNRNWKYNGQNEGPRSSQLEIRGAPQSGSRFSNSVSPNDFEESMMKLHAKEGQGRDKLESGAHQKIREIGNHSQGKLDDLEDRLDSSLQIDEGSEGKNTKEKGKSRDKDYRSDKRGQWILGQRIRIMKRQTSCRRDIDSLNPPFLAIYQLLIPPEEEKQKQEKLLTILGSLVKKEWPDAKLHVYGSCANSFGFSKSDIDICLVIQNIEINKAEILLKLAETLELNNFQNVQALTRARVPIVKLMDPDTGISCDICINNILAVINTKLLHDYAQIDGRLRQLAFIVKHWAKRRGVNETYQGTLSSYAYVLMCISFLQQRKPAILPCLQGMEPTYSVTVENRECAYFNEVDRLYGFGARNGETIARLVWAFFTYWAYCHDYTNDVISVRTGHTLSKQAKDWTRRIGNDRHLICIEDPFEISHDLGRVVDKASIRVLREEFERAAEIMQHDSDPCTKLFEPYVPN